MSLYSKTYYDKSVCIKPKHRKFDIMFLFDDNSQSRDFYNSFNCNREGLILRRIIIFFCRHRNMYKLDIGSKTHHYTYCPDCKMALFVDDETEEDKARKRDSLILMLEEVEVKRLRSEVSKLSSKLARRKNLLSEMEAELAIKIEEHNSKYNHQQVEL